VNERNFSTAAHGDQSLLCRLTLGVSFRFAAAVSLFGRRRLGGHGYHSEARAVSRWSWEKGTVSDGIVTNIIG